MTQQFADFFRVLPADGFNGKAQGIADVIGKALRVAEKLTHDLTVLGAALPMLSVGIAAKGGCKVS